MSMSKYYSYYTHAGRISKTVECFMYLSAAVFLFNACCPTIREFSWWKYVINANTILLLFINIGLMIVSWLNFVARGNKLAGCIDDAYGTSYALEPARPGYYDNSIVEDPDLRFALNAYECCFFSDTILEKQAIVILVKNLLIAVLFCVAIALEYGHVVMTILGLFIVIHYLRKLFVFFVVKTSLSGICGSFQAIFNTYKKTGQIDLQDVMLNMSNYETAMVWLGTVLSKKIYEKYNEELTNDWLAKQQVLVRPEDLIQSKDN